MKKEKKIWSDETDSDVEEAKNSSVSKGISLVEQCSKFFKDKFRTYQEVYSSQNLKNNK